MMSRFIDITNRQQLNESLQSLKEDTVPLWGKMKSQQMIEHLIGDVEYTNGKKIFICELPAEEADRNKQKWIYTDVEIPKNLVLGPLPDVYRFASLEAATGQLLKELDDFDTHFKTPGTTADQLAYGPMDDKEWQIWHGKHFTHHFKQFGLID